VAGRRVLLVVALVLAAVLLAFLHGPAREPGGLVGVISGKRYPFEVPGAVRLSLFSPYGEADAWVRITAYP
jgi:hypothetical protein